MASQAFGVQQHTQRSPWWIQRLFIAASIGLLYVLTLVQACIILSSPPQVVITIKQERGEPRIDGVLLDSDLWDAGVRAGDLIVDLNGQPPTPGISGTWRGNQMTVRSTHGMFITFDQGVIRDQFVTWSLLIISGWCFLLGTLIWLRAQTQPITRFAYAYLTSVAFALALLPSSDNNVPEALILARVTLPLSSVFFLLFCFALVERPFARARTLLMLTFGGIALTLLLSHLWEHSYPTTVLLWNIVTSGYLLIGLAVLFWPAHTGSVRGGVAIVRVGVVVALLPALLLYFAPMAFGKPPQIPTELATLPLALLPASMTYAIFRHRLWKIAAIQRWMLWGLIWFAIFLGVLALHSFRQLVVGGLSEPWQSVVLTFIVVALAGIMGGWLGPRFYTVLERFLFPDAYDYRTALHAMSNDLAHAADFHSVAAWLPERLKQLMHVQFVALFIHKQDVQVAGQSGTFSPALLTTLQHAKEHRQRTPQCLVVAGETVLVAPLCSYDILLGWLCLGPKANDERFQRDDIDFISTISGQIGSMVDTSHLLARLQEQIDMLNGLNTQLQQAHETERARLSADIHDEPLQTAMYLRRMLDPLATHYSAVAALIPTSQMVVDQLRDVCTRVRPAILDDLGLFAALESLAEQARERSHIRAIVHVDPDALEIGLSLAQETLLYRVSQEALTNALRHGRARNVVIRVRCEAMNMLLSIQDDGCGFGVPACFTDLVHRGHLGLAGVQERVRQFGGQLNVESVYGEGTLVYVRLPIEEQTT